MSSDEHGHDSHEYDPYGDEPLEIALILVTLAPRPRPAVGVGATGEALSTLFERYLRVPIELLLHPDFGVVNLRSGDTIDARLGVRDAGLRPGDVVVHGPRHFHPLFATPALPDDFSYEDAITRVRAFRQGSSQPEWVTCRVSDEEFETLVREAVARLPEAHRGDSSLVTAMMHSLDQNTIAGVGARDHVVAELDQLIREGGFCPDALRRSLGLVSRHPPAAGRRLRLVANTAALHLIPPPDREELLHTQAHRGWVNVGPITVTTDHIFDGEFVPDTDDDDGVRRDDRGPPNRPAPGGYQ